MPVGGGLAPCGLTPDPSGDVWVANCYSAGSGRKADVVRIDASTLDFKETLTVPGGTGFYRGLAFGGGSLWVSPMENHNMLTEIDPRTRATRSIRLARRAGALAWSEGYGDLLNNFDLGSVTRLHVQRSRGDRRCSRRDPTFRSSTATFSGLVTGRPRAWTRACSGVAQSAPHLPADAQPHSWRLEGCYGCGGGVGDDATRWRAVADRPQANQPTRIPLAHLPTWVTVGPDGALWLTVRGR